LTGFSQHSRSSCTCKFWAGSKLLDSSKDFLEECSDFRFLHQIAENPFFQKIRPHQNPFDQSNQRIDPVRPEEAFGRPNFFFVSFVALFPYHPVAKFPAIFDSFSKKVNPILPGTIYLWEFRRKAGQLSI
jgi:hypothetical protein